MSINNCPKCNNLYETDYEVCPYCGYHLLVFSDDKLPTNYVLHNRYIIESSTHKRISIWLYHGFDTKNNIEVDIKEYDLGENTIRKPDGSLSYIEANNINESKKVLLDRFQAFNTTKRIKNIICPIDYFEDNNTIYTVTPSYSSKWKSLYSHIKKYGILSFDKAAVIFKPILEAVSNMHKNNILHASISASDILIMDSKSRLIFSGETIKMRQQIHPVFYQPGKYNPIESHSAKREEKEYTDIYSLSVVIYIAITGIYPDNPYERMSNDSLKRPSELGVDIPEESEYWLMKGLEIYPEDRPQTMNEFMNIFTNNKD